MNDNELLDEDRLATPGKSRSKRAVKAALTDKASEQTSKSKQTKTSRSTQRSGAEKKREDTDSDHQPGESEMYRISYRIALAWCTRLHERTADEPLYRRLRVYSINPGLTRSDSGIAVCKIPYEPLTPGPGGSVMEVSNRGIGDDTWCLADLEHPHVVMQDGYHPSLSDPRFHQQMVYAVAMETYDK